MAFSLAGARLFAFLARSGLFFFFELFVALLPFFGGGSAGGGGGGGMITSFRSGPLFGLCQHVSDVTRLAFLALC